MRAITPAPRWRIAAFGTFALLTACNQQERTTINEVANGGNSIVVDEAVRTQAEDVMAPLDPPAPGTPGGLPISPPVQEEQSIAPGSPQGAAQIVQGYYGLLEEQRFGEARRLWSETLAPSTESEADFAARFGGFSEIHANVGAPGMAEGAAGSVFVTVPVQVYARVKPTGQPFYTLRTVTLRRVNDVPGSTTAQRRWHIESIGPYVPPAPAAAAAERAAP
ncbi:hypothetical protein PX699_02040 [Sphingobium sp. H39-3-25]|uniref:hypothetical protein n=1 Tax=Sphingobium arseniciresistens TaxID=3030834 RepID=UPI0023B903D4|nr:hypothetical protein [Sphingobium arseniciresistens]